MSKTVKSLIPDYFTRVVIITCFLLILLVLFLPKPKAPEEQEVQQDFCTRLPRVRIPGRDPAAVAEYERLWKTEKVLKVYFHGTYDSKLLRKIISIANTWAAYCDMSFERTLIPFESDIRVTFSYGGYASAIGMEAENEKYKTQPTMHLEGLPTLKDSSKFKRTVLHEFGHALGLDHELQNPAGQIPWDTVAVFSYYAEKFKLTRPEVIKQVLEPLLEAEHSEFDSTSIMIYAVPSTLTNGILSISWPNEISLTDQKYIRKWYNQKHKKNN